MTRDELRYEVLSEGCLIVSEGSLREEDLCKAFLPFVEEGDEKDEFESFLEEGDWQSCWEGICEYFDSLLQDEPFFFGSAEGDPACVGFWKNEESEDIWGHEEE